MQRPSSQKCRSLTKLHNFAKRRKKRQTPSPARLASKKYSTGKHSTKEQQTKVVVLEWQSRSFPAYFDRYVDMDRKLVESYLDYIAGKVVDEDKIVTYKSLSRSLNIHVNTAKQLLHTFLRNEKSKNTFPLSATYLIAGKVIDGSFNISIVNESDLKTAHSKLIQVTSEHVYSVQKGKSLKEIKFLCGVDKESTSKSSVPVIKFFKNVLREKEVKKKSDVADDRKIIKQALVSAKETSATEVDKKTETAETSLSKKTSPKGNSEKAETSVKKPTGNIASLFAKAHRKQSEVKADSFKDEPKSGVANDEETTDEKSSERETSQKGDHPRESAKRKKKGNKRRRIQMASDSEESDRAEEEYVEINLEDEQSPPRVNSVEEEIEEIRESVSGNKRKKRKVIDRTVMNEDGYLETKKEIVFETDSENEVEDVTKPAEGKKPRTDKGKGVHGAKKQSSLLSFFKKG